MSRKSNKEIGQSAASGIRMNSRNQSRIQMLRNLRTLSEGSIRPNLEDIRKKIAANFYEQPSVLNKTAEKLLNLFKTK